MKNIIVEPLSELPVRRRETEYVERKGKGHPDSICDAVMETVSVALGQAYLKLAGRILHYNLDKALLIAGQSTPSFGGGRIAAPMRLVVGDRATCAVDGTPIPVEEIVRETVSRWFHENLRYVDVERHLIVQHEIQPGSPELVGIFNRPEMIANDTSAAVGYAPLSETEQIVLATERYLNSSAFKRRFPETGEDVKIMGVRRGRRLDLTVAMAFVDRLIPNERSYFERKESVRQDLVGHLKGTLVQLDDVEICFNMLDQSVRGVEGTYLTVLGTSAEGGDSGEVGRGNNVNGLISLNRPSSHEAAAGKNPFSHVGKIYNLLAFQAAGEICSQLDAVEEASVWLCSQIGRPIAEPWLASIALALAPGARLVDVSEAARDILEQQIADIPVFSDRLLRGELAVC